MEPNWLLTHKRRQCTAVCRRCDCCRDSRGDPVGINAPMEDQIANTGRNQTGSEKCENVHKQTGFHLKITNSNNKIPIHHKSEISLIRYLSVS